MAYTVYDSATWWQTIAIRPRWRSWNPRSVWKRRPILRGQTSTRTELLSLDRARAEAALERGKDKLDSISKQGDRYLRGLFTAGALAVIRYAKIHGTQHRPWLTALLTRRPTKVAAIALANKIARMAWAKMAKGELQQ